MPSILENLKSLCLLTGVSGYENKAVQKAAQLLKEFTPDAHIDEFGNAIGTIRANKENAKTLLLDAHIDEIGMIVTSIDDKGFLKVSNCGGVDRRILSAQKVIVHGKKDIVGIVGSKPPHLQIKGDEKKISDWKEVFIDVGMTKEQAEKIISLGDRITFYTEFAEILNGRVSCKALDDRAGIVSILEALRLVSKKDLPVHLAVQFTGREEVGGQGAKIAGYTLNPDFAVAVDVSFAYNPDCDVNKCGKMGEGVMIGSSPAIDKAFTDKLIKIAKDKEIPYQIEVMGGRGTGTNADDIAVSRSGVRTALLSIPLKCMHTPVEQVQLTDIKATARLMEEFIMTAGEE